MARIEHKVGERVGAIHHSTSSHLYFLGYGVYEGEQLPVADGNESSLATVMARLNMKNPRIKLDNGDVVWGMECWWGPEDYIKRTLESAAADGRIITDVRIADMRAVPTTAETGEGNVE